MKTPAEVLGPLLYRMMQWRSVTNAFAVQLIMIAPDISRKKKGSLCAPEMARKARHFCVFQQHIASLQVLNNSDCFEFARTRNCCIELLDLKVHLKLLHSIVEVRCVQCLNWTCKRITVSTSPNGWQPVDRDNFFSLQIPRRFKVPTPLSVPRSAY